MSDYHVRAISKDGRNANIIFHIPIPVENNSANVALRLALSEYIKSQAEDGSFSDFNSVLQGIDAGESTQLRNGELFEIQESVKFLSADNNAQKQTKIDNRYTTLTTKALNNIREILKFWGMDRDVI